MLLNMYIYIYILNKGEADWLEFKLLVHGNYRRPIDGA